MGPLEQLTRWSLKDLYAEPAAAAVDVTLSQIEQVVCELEAMRARLAVGISPEDFKAALDRVEKIAVLKSRVMAYAELWLSEDMQNPEALNLRDHVSQVLTDLANRCMFFDLWFKELPDEEADRLKAHAGDLRYYLDTIRRFQPYTLTEREEQIISSKDINGIDAVVSIYNMVTTAFTFKLEIDGEIKTLTRDELTGYFDSPSADVRARAYDELYRVYQENATLLSQMYMYRARDWHAEGMELRGYPSAIAPRNLDNDLPDEVVETLLAVCRKNAGIFQRYFEIKRRWLGLEKFRRYDIYAPLTPVDKLYDWSEATKMVLDSYGAFSPEVTALVRRVFDEDHVDSEPRHGKMGGAFCYTALPELTPWVMVNYAGRVHDIATLAHELGHAIHNMLACEHSAMTQQSSLPLAETASVFGEMLLTNRLLELEKDPAVRRELLAHAMDAAYLTVMRQAYFTIFEKEAHEMIAAGASADELSEHYMANLREQFGEAVDVADEFRLEWIGVPHMMEVPFYTYAYSFGQMLVLALYEQYRREGAAFIPRYLRILSYGGAEAPLKVLSEAGLDVTSPAFWQGGFDYIEKMLAELEQLA